MSGTDILYWLGEIWYDVTHLADADIPWLLFRLFVLLAAIVVAQKLIEIIARIFGDVLQPVAQFIRNILKGIWWVISAPVRLPYLGFVKLRENRRRKRQQRQIERQRVHDEAIRQQEIESAAQVKRDELHQMKAMLSPLE